MRLTSIDGSFVDLRILRHQFPATTEEVADEDWDDWLIVQGDVADVGRHWQFTDPCLTTAEARELLSWLRGVASGAVEMGDEQAKSLWFTEPNLELRLQGRTPETAVISWSFAAEAAPPVDRDRPVSVEAPFESFLAAADQWERELAEFPRRHRSGG